MSRLYNTLRRGLQLAVDLFYVDVRMTGADRIPAEGPVIFAANHPNSIMDTVILGTQIDRQLHYLAKSELFANPLVARLFDACGVIPLHRNPEGDQANDEGFASAFELLASGRCLGIFPEGRNSLERGILKIKTGTARIALAAEQRHDYELGVRIVPVGLNFENRNRFMSRVVVRVGDPIRTSDYGDIHLDEEREAVRALTDRVEGALRKVVSTMKDDRTRQLAEQVDRIYGRELLEETLREREQIDVEAADEERALVDERTERRSHRPRLRDRLMNEIKQHADIDEAEEFDQRLKIQQRIADAIDYYSEQAPELVEELQMRLRRYVDHLDQFRIRGDLTQRLPETGSRRREVIKLTAYAVAFALPTLWGLVHNVVPYQLTRLAAWQAPDEPMRAFTGLLAGLLLFVLTYTAIGWSVWSWSGGEPWMTAAYLGSLPVTGFFFLRYRRQVSKYRNHILTRTLFLTRKREIDGLLAERDELIDAFDTLREHFRKVDEAEAAGQQPPSVPDIELSPYFGP